MCRYLHIGSAGSNNFGWVRRSFPMRCSLESILDDYFSRYNFVNATPLNSRARLCLVPTDDVKRRIVNWYQVWLQQTGSSMKHLAGSWRQNTRTEEYTWGQCSEWQETGNTWSASSQPWSGILGIRNIFTDWQLMCWLDRASRPLQAGRGKKLRMSNKWWHDPNICHSHATITQKMKWPMNMKSLTETSQSCITTSRASHDTHINNSLYSRRHSY